MAEINPGALFVWQRGTRGPMPAIILLRKPPANKHERNNNPLIRQFEITADEVGLGLGGLAAKYPLIDRPPVGEVLPSPPVPADAIADVSPADLARFDAAVAATVPRVGE